ncbi:MAG: DNA circularization N-terminal domain-containing protein [Acutalibacteraceae bacterium]
MTLSPMRFRGFTWLHNPKEITVSCENVTKEIKISNGQSILQDFGRKNRVISGIGEIYGQDCFFQYNKLWELYSENVTGVLSIPETGSMYADFCSLKCIGKGKDFVTYSFVFKEQMREPSSKAVTRYKATSGENLWDVSYKFSVSVERLLEINKSIARPDEDLEGREVKLC